MLSKRGYPCQQLAKITKTRGLSHKSRGIKVGMTQARFSPLILPGLASLALHGLILLFLNYLWGLIATMEVSEQKSQDRAIKVTTMTQEQLNKYRTVGVKNGSKDFSTPTKKPIKRTKTTNESIKLGELGSVDNVNIPKPQRAVPKPEATPDLGGLQIINDSQAPVEVRATRIQDRYQSLRNMGVAEDDAKKLSQTDFDVNFVPPEGVSEDELNSAEKMFYSFQKRTYEAYVNSFLSTYNSMVRTLPRVRAPLMNERHFLTARVIFDTDGNIMSIRILRSSPNDDIHQLFEKTLRNIRKLPNPPQDLVAKDNTFTIYYQLKIN